MPTITENFKRKNLREIDTVINSPIPSGPALPDIGDGLSPKK